tara:strand:- start:110 stop:520 length:411 start_codon:yes stop_codon:yes gene_type:complete
MYTFLSVHPDFFSENSPSGLGRAFNVDNMYIHGRNGDLKTNPAILTDEYEPNIQCNIANSLKSETVYNKDGLIFVTENRELNKHINHLIEGNSISRAAPNQTIEEQLDTFPAKHLTVDGNTPWNINSSKYADDRGR